MLRVETKIGNSQTKKNFAKGFSLVEILVVMMIMVVMTGTLLVSRSKSKQTTQVELAARQVASQIRQLQVEALNGKVVDGTNACRYIFESSVASTYSLKYSSDCAVENLIPLGTQTFDLASKKVSFDGVAVSLFFSAPRGNVDGIKTIVLKSTTDPTLKSWICISANGIVTEQKTACL